MRSWSAAPHDEVSAWGHSCIITRGQWGIYRWDRATSSSLKNEKLYLTYIDHLYIILWIVTHSDSDYMHRQMCCCSTACLEVRSCGRCGSLDLSEANLWVEWGWLCNKEVATCHYVTSHLCSYEPCHLFLTSSLHLSLFIQMDCYKRKTASEILNLPFMSSYIIM